MTAALTGAQLGRVAHFPAVAARCPQCHEAPGEWCVGGATHMARYDAAERDPRAVLRLLDAAPAKGLYAAAVWLRVLARAAGGDPDGGPGEPWREVYEYGGDPDSGPDGTYDGSGDVIQSGVDPDGTEWEEPVAHGGRAVAAYLLAVQPAGGVAVAGLLEAVALLRRAPDALSRQAVDVARTMLTLVVEQLPPEGP